MELVFNPRTTTEKYISQALRFIHPYLAFVTYRFHVEKSREIGKCSPVTAVIMKMALSYFNLILYRY